MYGLLLFVMVGAVVWMAADAYHAGRSWGSIISWVLGALLVWLLVFPWYLVNRRTYAEERVCDDSANHHPAQWTRRATP